MAAARRDREEEVPPFYGRPGLNVETYDLRAAGDMAGTSVEGDIAFYVEQAEAIGGPVLDLGGGTGRVAWELAQVGFDVLVLDLSQEMLGEGERNREGMPADVRARVRFVQGDMATFDLDEAFALAITPFRSFQALLTAEAQRSCLRAVHRHLRTGGTLVLDVFDPRLDLCVPEVTAPPRAERASIRHPRSGNEVTIRVLSRRNDPLRQVLEERWEFSELDASGAILRREEEVLRMRWTYRWEMRYLLELTGFEATGEYGDFRGSPPAYGREQVWVTRKRWTAQGSACAGR